MKQLWFTKSSTDYFVQIDHTLGSGLWDWDRCFSVNIIENIENLGIIVDRRLLYIYKAE